MAYFWHIANDTEFNDIYSFLLNSPVKDQWGEDDVRRRVVVPLFLGQLVLFTNDDGKICGMITIGFMSPEAAAHEGTTGVQNEDWRSGDQLWVVDFVANDGGGAAMLRLLTRAMNKEKWGEVKYYRLKHHQVREVRPCQAVK